MIMVDFAWEQATIGSINSSNDTRESTCLKPMFTCLRPNDSASCRSHTSFVQEVLLGVLDKQVLLGVLEPRAAAIYL